MLVDQIGLSLLPSQHKAGGSVLARAFADDPFFTFVLPEPTRRIRILNWLFEKTIRYGLLYGKVFTTPGLDGIAIWLHLQRVSLNFLGTLRSGLFQLPFHLSGQELARCLRLSHQTDRLHEQSITGPHWYLQGLGVEPARRGLGIGSSLLQPVLALADQKAIACYLDTTKEQNLSFYARHGFAVTGHKPSKHGEPPIWGMLRQPR